MDANMIEQLFYRLVSLDIHDKYRIDVCFSFYYNAQAIAEQKQKDFNNQIIICVNDFFDNEDTERMNIHCPNIKCYILIENSKVIPNYSTNKYLLDNYTFYNIWLEDENGNYLLGTL